MARDGSVVPRAQAKTRLLLYGAYGYTGRLTAELAAARRLDVVLAGRNGGALAALGDRLGLATRVVGLDEPNTLCGALHDIRCVVHMAGPFVDTSRPMLSACVATQTDYIDITGEIEVFEAIWARQEEIQRAGITVVPGAGFDVVPTDCLAAYVAKRLESPVSLVIALAGLDGASQGTLRTAVRQIAQPVLCRRAGIIGPLKDRSPRRVDFGSGNEPCVPLSWGDVATAFHSTGVGNVTVYVRRTRMLRAVNTLRTLMGPVLRSQFGQRALSALVRRAPEGPSAADRVGRHTRVWAEALDSAGRASQATVSTPDAYDFTAISALEIASRLARLPSPLGLVTASQAFGADFVLDIPGCSRTDVPFASPVVPPS